MLQFYICVILVLSISKCFCDIINFYNVPREREDAFKSTWNLIKAQSPIHWDGRRMKRTGKTTTSTTERISSILQIPILPVPKSRYQYLYRIKQPPSPRNHVKRVSAPKRHRKSEQHIETSTRRVREATDKSVYYIDFKNFKVKFFYNINLDF